MNNIKQITPSISEIKTGTPGFKIGNQYFVGGIGGNFIPAGGVDVSDTTATAADVLTGKAFYLANGTKTTGIMSQGFQLAKVTQYTPHEDELTATGTVAISGIGTIAGTDYSAWNGTYTVTEATKKKSDETKRVYKLGNEEKYLYYYGDEYDNNYWCIGSNPSQSYYYAILCYSGSTIPSGSNSWMNYDYYESYDVTTTKTNTTYPEVLMVLQGNMATDYSASTGWTFSQAVTNFASAQKTPKVGYVYMAENNGLYGNPIMTAANVPNDMSFYLPFETDLLDYSTGSGQTAGTWSGTMPTITTFGGRQCADFTGGRLQSMTYPSDQFSGSFSLSIWFSFDTQPYKMGALIGYGVHEYNFVNVWDYYFFIWDTKVTGENVVPNTWYHAVCTYDSQTQTKVAYCNGAIVRNDTGTVENIPYLCIGGRPSQMPENPAYFDGKISDVRFFKRALTAAEVDALYNNN